MKTTNKSVSLKDELTFGYFITDPLYILLVFSSFHAPGWDVRRYPRLKYNANRAKIVQNVTLIKEVHNTDAEYTFVLRSAEK